MITPFIILFLLPGALRGTKSTSNIAHVLSRVSNMIDKRQWQKEKKLRI